MKFKSLYDLVESNAQKNRKSDVIVTELTKPKINRYKNYTYEKKLITLPNCPFNFPNYSKIIDKLNDTNLYFEIATAEGFYLLEFNGLKFKSIEHNDSINVKSLKRYEALDELNKEYNEYINDRYKNRADAMAKAEFLERKFIMNELNRKKQQKDNDEDKNL